jgi:hypothetical protein
MAQTTRERHERRKRGLINIRTDHEDHWQELADFIAPNRYRPDARVQKGQKNRQRIIDPTGGVALRTLQSGMQAGITSPSRPWFRLTTFNRELREVKAVKDWLFVVQTRMREVFAASNFYTTMHRGYGDLGLFGQAPMLINEDRDDYIRCMGTVHGQFWMAADQRGVVSTLYRRMDLTVEQCVARWKGSVSPLVRRFYDRSDYDELVTVWHAVEPRLDRDPTKIDARNMSWASNYWEDGDERLNAMLQESGFKTNPIVAPRWDLVADEDHYGVSPGMDALPEVKMLQTEQIRKGEGIDHQVRPAMLANSALRNKPHSRLPGTVTFVDDVANGMRPVREVVPQINYLMEDIRDVRDRINSVFFADLFLMINQMEGIQPRNEMEIAERKEERLIQLGPVLERMHTEALGPSIDRVFDLMMARKAFPPPPRELENEELKVDFISILAQAQRAIGVGAIERTVGFVGNLAAIDPEVVDKIDRDQIVDEYSDMVGMPANLIRSDDDVAAIRAERQRLKQAQQQAEMMATAAPALKDGAQAAQILANTDARSNPGNLLANLGIG